jgi:hypothetical protein
MYCVSSSASQNLLLTLVQALALSSTSPENHIQQIIEKTSGIVFMGTPHLGADAAKYASYLTGLSSWFRPTNQDIVGVLERDSEVLANLTASFEEMLRKRRNERKKEPEMVCFLEEKPMQKGLLSHRVRLRNLPCAQSC